MDDVDEFDNINELQPMSIISVYPIPATVIHSYIMCVRYLQLSCVKWIRFKYNVFGDSVVQFLGKCFFINGVTIRNRSVAKT